MRGPRLRRRRHGGPSAPRWRGGAPAPAVVRSRPPPAGGLPRPLGQSSGVIRRRCPDSETRRLERPASARRAASANPHLRRPPRPAAAGGVAAGLGGPRSRAPPRRRRRGQTRRRPARVRGRGRQRHPRSGLTIRSSAARGQWREGQPARRGRGRVTDSAPLAMSGPLSRVDQNTPSTHYALRL